MWLTRSAPPSRGAQEGDEVSCLLLSLGGYGEYALASSWTPKPPNVSWSDAAALPSSSRDQDVVRGLGGVPVTYGPGLADRVGEIRPHVDAVLDAAGKGQLQDAVNLAGGPARVTTLADEHAADQGVTFSAATPDRAPEAVDQTIPLPASGVLRLRRQRQLPMADAAEAHRLLEKGESHEKLILEGP